MDPMKTSHRLLLLALTAVVCVRLSEPATGATASVPGTLTAEDLATLRSGDARRLEAALDRGVSVHARDVRGNTPLMLATLHGAHMGGRSLVTRISATGATVSKIELAE